MKTALLLLLACAGVLVAFAVPHLGRASDAAPELEVPQGVELESGASASELDVGTQSASSRRLIVLAKAETQVDRGIVSALGRAHSLEGSFRYWDEPQGQVLYVWDEAQNLVSRVVNPSRVLVVEVTP